MAMTAVIVMAAQGRGPEAGLSRAAPFSPPSIERPAEARAAALSDVRGDARALVFRARLAAFSPFEDALRRAFHPAERALETRPRPVRVMAPGRTPQDCLTQAVYYEARGEPQTGQAAVAQVVLNRSRSGVHPRSICGVVFEGADRSGCQFSFACDPRLAGGRVNGEAWRRASTVAEDALAGRELPSLQTALNYHADYVHPRWAAGLQRTAEIGRHIFYAALSPFARTSGAVVPSTPPPPAPTE